MESEPRQLHVFFLAQMADEILMPTIELARLFARHGMKATIISTPLNTPPLKKLKRTGNLVQTSVFMKLSSHARKPGCQNDVRTLIPSFTRNSY